MGVRIRTHDDLLPSSFPNLFHSLNKIYSKRELRYDVKLPNSQRGEAKILFGNEHKIGSITEWSGCKSNVGSSRLATGGISKLLVFCALCCLTDFMPLVRCRQLSSLLQLLSMLTSNQVNTSINILCCWLFIEYPNSLHVLGYSTSNDYRPTDQW